MVSNEVVLQTVRRMVASGVDDDTIKMTLRGVNMDEDEIKSILSEARGVSSEDQKQAEEAVSGPNPNDTNAGGDYAGKGEPDNGGSDDYDAGESDGAPAVEDLKREMRTVSEGQDAQHSATHNMLEEHSNRISDLHENVSKLHKKVDSAPTIQTQAIAKLNVLDERISALEKEVSETKANTVALQEILRKVLETNRKTLQELQKK